MNAALKSLAVCAAMIYGAPLRAQDAGTGAAVDGRRTAASADYDLAFGPYVGGGTISTGARVPSTTGYSLQIERHWDVVPGLALGPVLALTNAFVVTGAKGPGGGSSVGTYDNRFVAAGFRLAHAVGNEHTLAQSVYFKGLAGRGFSKLSVDDGNATSYRQKLYGNIRGNYFSAELGAYAPLKDALGIELSLLSDFYRADQSQAQGTFQGQSQNDGVVSLVEGAYAAPANGLPRSVTMRSYAGKFSISLGL